jgi:hydrogenase expression/formation protein HypD
MKYLDEFRDQRLVQEMAREIHQRVTRPWTLMEICGGQTHSLIKNGLLDLLPSSITMVHGPGCPVCVTPASYIDEAIRLASEEDVILCSFGDMLRVPGHEHSLLYARARGADIRMVYSPLEAVRLAEKNPEREVVLFAVGFETTAPANGLAILQANQMKCMNFSMLCSHVLVPPAMKAILDDPDQHVQGFLAAGHVCSVTGMRSYEDIVDQYKIPVVVTGFEPADLLMGISKVIAFLERGEYGLENAYKRVVDTDGNVHAQKIMEEVFEVCHQDWRGMGGIPASGLKIREHYADWDAIRKFNGLFASQSDENGCIAGDVLKGIRKPRECPHFGTNCTPMHPMGAPMVSSEGACAAYHQYT